MERLSERAYRGFGIVARGGFAKRSHSGTKDSDEIRAWQQLMKLLTNRVGALAFRAGEGAHQKDGGDAVGIRARRQPGIYFRRREMPGIYFFAA